MPTYATTNDDILTITDLRKSANLLDTDTSFDSELILHRNGAVEYITGYLQRPLLKTEMVQDILLMQGGRSQGGNVWMQKHVPDFIGVNKFEYVSDDQATNTEVNTTLIDTDLEVYYQSDDSLLRVFFRHGIPTNIKAGSPLLWTIEMGVDYETGVGSLIKATVEAYAKGLFLGSDVERLGGYVKNCLENHRNNYELSFVTERKLMRERSGEEIGNG